MNDKGTFFSFNLKTQQTCIVFYLILKKVSFAEEAVDDDDHSTAASDTEMDVEPDDELDVAADSQSQPMDNEVNSSLASVMSLLIYHLDACLVIIPTNPRILKMKQKMVQTLAIHSLQEMTICSFFQEDLSIYRVRKMKIL